MMRAGGSSLQGDGFVGSCRQPAGQPARRPCQSCIPEAEAFAFQTCHDTNDAGAQKDWLLHEEEGRHLLETVALNPKLPKILSVVSTASRALLCTFPTHSGAALPWRGGRA